MSLWFEARQKRQMVAVVGAFGLSLAACAKPQMVSEGETAQNGPLSVQVEGHTVQRLDVEGPAGAVTMDRNTLVVRLVVTNQGTTPLRWDPGFGPTGVTQAQNVLLYSASTWEEGLSPANNIPTLSLGAWKYLGDPVTEPVEIAPGETIRDVLLFSEPSSSTTSLILSVPPKLAGPEAKLPIYIQIPYNAGDSPSLGAAAVEETITQDGLAFTVRGAEIAYQRVRNPDGSESIGASPLFKIRFRVKNESDAAVEYIPTRMAAGKDFPALTDQSGAIQNRAIFPAGVTPVGQQSERQSLAPGATLDDFILFERPVRTVESLILTYPGSRLGGKGLFRVQLPYTWSDPEVPEEFRPRN